MRVGIRSINPSAICLSRIASTQILHAYRRPDNNGMSGFQIGIKIIETSARDVIRPQAASTTNQKRISRVGQSRSGYAVSVRSAMRITPKRRNKIPTALRHIRICNDGFAQPKSVIVERISQCNGLATSRKLGILHCARNVEDNRIRVQGAIPVRALRGTRRRRALREDADLERLDAVADAGRAGAGPVAGPPEPAVVLHVGAVPHVVVLGEAAGQAHLDALDRPALPGGAGHGAVRDLVLPADAGDVGAVGQAAGDRRGDLGRDRLYGAGLAGGAGGAAVADGGLPADARDVGPEAERGDGELGGGARRWGVAALLDEDDLERLGLDTEALGARGLAVLGPAEPAVARRVDAVPDVIGIGDGAGEGHPHGLDGAALPHRAGVGGGGGGVLPADAGHIGRDGDGAPLARPLEGGAHRLEREAPAGRADVLAAAHRLQPAALRDMALQDERRAGGGAGDEGPLGRAGGGAALRDESDLDCGEARGARLDAGGLAGARPAGPAARGVAGTVPDVVALGEAAGQLEADGLELEPAARGDELRPVGAGLPLPAGAEQEAAVADRPVGLEVVDNGGDGAQHGSLLGAERQDPAGERRARRRAGDGEGRAGQALAGAAEGTADRARRGAALGDEHDLDGLDGLRQAHRARGRAVLGPAEPAVVGAVHAVPDIVGRGGLAGEPELERLDRQGAPGGAGGARGPALPADVRDVGPHLEGGGAVPVPGHGAREGLEGAALPGGAGHGAVRDGALPADAGDVGAVGDRGGLGGPVDEGRGRVARGGFALGQDRDLDGLDGAAVARRAGVGAVARPAEPPELGGVDAVPDGVAGRQVRGQPDPQGLDGAGPAGGAGGAAVADGGLPADVGDVGLDGYGVGAEGLAGRRVGQDEAQRLEGEPPAGRAATPPPATAPIQPILETWAE